MLCRFDEQKFVLSNRFSTPEITKINSSFSFCLDDSHKKKESCLFKQKYATLYLHLYWRKCCKILRPTQIDNLQELSISISILYVLRQFRLTQLNWLISQQLLIAKLGKRRRLQRKLDRNVMSAMDGQWHILLRNNYNGDAVEFS